MPNSEEIHPVNKGLVTIQDGNNFNISSGITILDDKERTFECWGSVEVMDKEREIIPIANIQKDAAIMARRGGNGAPLMYGHSNKRVGVVTDHDFLPYTLEDGRKVPSVRVRGRVYKDYRVDDVVWDEIRKGIIRGLSIGGVLYRKRTVCNERGECADVHLDDEFFEWSLAKSTVNPLSVQKGEGVGIYSGENLQGSTDGYLIGTFTIQEKEVDTMADTPTPEPEPAKTPEPEKDVKKGDVDDVKSLRDEFVQTLKEAVEEVKKGTSGGETPADETGETEVTPVTLAPEAIAGIVAEVKKGLVEDIKGMVDVAIKDVYKGELKGLLAGAVESETPTPAGGPDGGPADTKKGAMEQVEGGGNLSGKIPTPEELLDPNSGWMPQL